MIADGDPEPVVDAYPLLRLILGPATERISFLACRELSREMYTEHGTIPEPLEFELRDEIAYHLTAMSDVDRIRRLSERLGKPLGIADAKEVINNAQAEEVQALLRLVRAAPTDAERLVLLVGGEALRAQIPSALLEAVEESDGDLDDIQTAELALTVFGIDVLKEYSGVLKDRGLSPPSQWAGLRPAIKFVTEELGFPRSYAGFAVPKLDESLEIPGPSSLPELHEFQKGAAAAIRQLIAKQANRRGLLSLPTGAGKTRVAVEALVKAMADGVVTPPVLWVAQTAELCEQAVQSWAEVWRAVGPERSLKLSRLWGGRQAVRREDEGDQVVVATIAQLDAGCMDNSDYGWLSEAGCIVVDEAHTSITPSWTRLLRWTSVDRNPKHAPLIGLSATPFRGVSKEETQRLVARYGGCRLDAGIFDEEVSIPLLQRQGILAEVEHQILAGSESVPLNKAEREHIEQMRAIPASVSEKIGRDLDRTNRLVDSVTSLPDNWPALIFAASVSHAETLAALIARRGRTAAAVSSGTDDGVRRHLVSEFRSGRLQTLTNYGVLTQGFDAPSIRALYIARPTYSPNLYLQMIGRGLRGPANNGKEVCLVVDVADNLVAYGLDLAFHEFDYLWKT
jgi:superfamily II DNA or RNA helicase